MMKISAQYPAQQMKYTVSINNGELQPGTIQTSDSVNLSSSEENPLMSLDNVSSFASSESEIKTTSDRKWYSFLTGLFKHTFGDSKAHDSLKPKPTDKAADGVNKGEMAARYTNNILLHLVGSDTPALMSIAANAGTLPSFLAPLLGPFNAINTATGIASIAADMRETAGTFRNPSATKMDKIMDASHLVLGDMVSTAASMLPMVTPLTSPVVMTMFVGGQLLGLGMDVAKTAYDISRNGQQSAYKAAN
ncbi:MAG: hypothetical protein LWY06_03695 [Firmicutes bacterium]|nr:hypothetical protein [Bacillota bacterium]